MDLLEYTLQRNGCTLHYWLAGDGSAPLVVLSHGAYIDHHEWDATIPIVLGAGFRVLTWDMRGHGMSRPAKFYLEEARADLLALLDAVKAQQAILVGHSMGGNLHQEVVFHHPERVQALVMLDCTWNFQKLSRADDWLLKLGLPMLGWYPYNMLVEAMANITTNDLKGREYLKSTFRTLEQKDFLHIMTEATLCLHHEPDYRIEKPILLILGDKDATGNIRNAMPLWAQHDNIPLVIIPNSGHAPNFDRPELFHQYLIDFLQRTPEAREPGTQEISR